MIGRIQDRAAFVRLRHEGTRVRIDPLWCSFIPDPSATPTRAAFAIGRATGNAVARNRLRRRLKAILAASDPPPGLLLIGARAGATELTFDQLRAVVDDLLGVLRQQVGP